jgi:hypothetical protein
MGMIRPYLVAIRMFLALIGLTLIVGKLLNPDVTPVYLLGIEANKAVENKLPYATNPLFAKSIMVGFALVSAYILIGTVVDYFREKREFGSPLQVASPFMLIALFFITFACFYYAAVGFVIGVYWLYAATLGCIGATIFFYELSQWKKDQ